MAERSTAPGLPTTIALYALARVGLVAVVAAVLGLVGVPLLIAVLVAIVVALPLSMVLFRGLRSRLDAALAVAGERRSAERAVLRARLRGEDGEDHAVAADGEIAAPVGSGDRGEGQPDGCQDRPGQQE